MVAVGCSLDEAEAPTHSEFSATVVKPTVADATAEEGAVCVSRGPSEEAGVLLCGSAGSRPAEEGSFGGSRDGESWLEWRAAVDGERAEKLVSSSAPETDKRV